MSAILKCKVGACAFCFCLGYSGPFVSDTSPKSIDREGLGESRTGTRQAISYIFDETCTAITEVIGKEFMQVPQSEEQWLHVREKFYQWWNFPNCLGAIDGKHIVMLQPAKSGGDSVVLLAIVGPNYEFLYVDVGANGQMSDGGIWNRCKFKESLVSTANPLDIPDPVPLPSRCKPVPYVIVGDDAFGLTEYLIKPFPKAQLTNDENRIYNYRYLILN